MLNNHGLVSDGFGCKTFGWKLLPTRCDTHLWQKHQGKKSFDRSVWNGGSLQMVAPHLRRQNSNYSCSLPEVGKLLVWRRTWRPFCTTVVSGWCVCQLCEILREKNELIRSMLFTFSVNILNEQFFKKIVGIIHMKDTSCVYMPAEWMPYHVWLMRPHVWLAHMAEQLRSGNRQVHLAQSTTVILQRLVDGCRWLSLKCERLYESKKQLICISLYSWSSYSDGGGGGFPHCANNVSYLTF